MPLGIGLGLSITLDENLTTGGVTPPAPSFILREDSGYILREDGSKFLHEH